MKPKTSRVRWRGCLFVFLGLAAILVLGGIYLNLFFDYAGPTQVTVDDPGEAPAESGFTLSDEQAQVMAELGPPQSFTILFYREPGEGSPEDIRFEVWRYYAAGRELTFVNGETSSDALLDVSSETLESTRYLPDQFGAYMGLEDLIARIGLAAYVRGASEPELVSGGELYFADRLAFAMLHGRLVAVEALALEAEG